MWLQPSPAGPGGRGCQDQPQDALTSQENDEREKTKEENCQDTFMWTWYTGNVSQIQQQINSNRCVESSRLNVPFWHFNEDDYNQVVLYATNPADSHWFLDSGRIWSGGPSSWLQQAAPRWRGSQGAGWGPRVSASSLLAHRVWSDPDRWGLDDDDDVHMYVLTTG